MKNSELETSLINLIEEIDFKLNHLEDMEADNRKLIAKLVKQGNTIVKFLKQFEVSEVDPDEMSVEMGMSLPPLNNSDDKIKRTEDLKELIDDILDRHADLKEFEKELKKHKDKITPGQVGES